MGWPEPLYSGLLLDGADLVNDVCFLTIGSGLQVAGIPKPSGLTHSLDQTAYNPDVR